MGNSVPDGVSVRDILIGLSIALFTHMLIISGCVWWWEIYKLNIDWRLHMERLVPSILYIFYAPSWFWIDLVISVIVFSSYTVLLVFTVLLARALGMPKSRFVIAVTLYTVLLLANWIWYEIFRANIRGVDRVDPKPDTALYLVWGDLMYIATAFLSFIITLVFIARTTLTKIEKIKNMNRARRSVFWILLVLELYIVMLIANYIWINLVAEVANERFFTWDFPSPFYLWNKPIYTWSGMAYFLILIVLAVAIGIVTYEEMKRNR
uniref:Uncharacterized protein n=1 Tax=Ignisphaera aggregans TaxID=334771 RepID=A0A7J3N055_9CREN